MKIFLGLYFLLTACTWGQVSTNSFLPKIDINSSDDLIQQYQVKLKVLVANPKALDAISPWDMKVLFNNMPIDLITNRISNEKWLSLRQDQAKLIGSMIVSLKHRIDPAVNINNPQNFVVPPPYDVVASPEDRTDDAKRKAYNDAAKQKIATYEHFNNQVQIHKELDYFIKNSKIELSLLYPNDNPPDSEELSILASVGLDRDAINTLTK